MKPILLLMLILCSCVSSTDQGCIETQEAQEVAVFNLDTNAIQVQPGKTTYLHGYAFSTAAMELEVDFQEDKIKHSFIQPNGRRPFWDLRNDASLSFKVEAGACNGVYTGQVIMESGSTLIVRRLTITVDGAEDC